MKVSERRRGNVMINSRAGIRAMKRGLLAVFLVGAISSVSQAGPLNVNIDPYPNILAGYITTTYIATTGAFTANGWALTLDTGTGQTSITQPFVLTANINNAGVASSGNLTIGGSSTPLLSSSSLIGFGFNPVQGGVLEFLFGTPGGSYVPSLYAANKPIDVQLTVGNTFLGNFASSWSSSSNTAMVREDPPVGTPEPSVLLLMVAGACGLCIRKRKV
jgi:hypothetical protein